MNATSQPDLQPGVDLPGVNLEVFFDGDEIQFIHDDRLAEALNALGAAQTRRASDVEPTDGGGWAADMARVGGPSLGPFPTRTEALRQEVAWLRQHHFQVQRGDVIIDLAG